MINLLPIAHKKDISRELLRRFVLVFGLGLGGLCLTQLLLLLAVFFWVNSSVEQFGRQMAVTEKLAKVDQVSLIEADVVSLNNLLGRYNMEKSSIRFFSEDLSKMLGVYSPAIKIDSFVLEKQNCVNCGPRITMEGHAATREALVAFADGLKRTEYFKQVTSPLSNLLSLSEIKFSIAVELK